MTGWAVIQYSIHMQYMVVLGPYPTERPTRRLAWIHAVQTHVGCNAVWLQPARMPPACVPARMPRACLPVRPQVYEVEASGEVEATVWDLLDSVGHTEPRLPRGSPQGRSPVGLLGCLGLSPQPCPGSGAGTCPCRAGHWP